jgi:hypothetical protein
MRHRCLASLGVLAIAVAVAGVSVAGQTPSPAAKAKTTVRAKAWTPPRTPDGQPDLQGVWANNNATPLERPPELAGRPFLTDEELAAMKKKAAELFNGDSDAGFGDAVFKAALASAEGKSTDIKKINGFDVVTGNYNQFWLVDREFDNRTSMITDPPDGKLPPLTPEAQKRQAAAAEARKLHPADGPEDLPLGHRCITFGAPRIEAGYNSYIQIFQTRDHVAIAMETIHDARIIPLDGRPHLPQNIRQWLGDPRGHWEGDTLVVDTTNYSPQSNFRGSHENLHAVERFTRDGPTTIKYEVTFDDPTTWTKPWTVMIPLKLSNEHIYEYACHEGNEGLAGALAGARAQERAAAEAAKKGSR